MPNVRHKIGDAVAEIARQYTDYGKLDQCSIGKILGPKPYNTLQDKVGPSYLEHCSRPVSQLMLVKERAHSEFLLRLQV
jgi:hypothetical protein